MNSAFKILPHYTYEDYCQWEGRWEIIDGIPYAMSPAPNPRHQSVGAKIIYELISSINKAGCKNCKVYKLVDLKFKEATGIKADVQIFHILIPKN